MPNDVSEPVAIYRSPSIDSRTSWIAAGMTLAILSVTYGSPLVIVVGMKTMQAELGTALGAGAGGLRWSGWAPASGGISMGWLADRIGVRDSVPIGAVMIAAGLALSPPARSGRSMSATG